MSQEVKGGDDSKIRGATWMEERGIVWLAVNATIAA